jgi:hypothetical protein
MKKFKKLFLIVTVLALALVSFETQAGLGDPQTLLSYTTSTTMFSGTGTNDTAGYTNTPVWVDMSKGSSMAIFLQAYGVDANASNNVTLYIQEAFSSTSTERASVAPGIRRIQLAPAGATGFRTITNVSGIYSPGVMISLENPATNPEALTNVVLRVSIKTP